MEERIPPDEPDAVDQESYREAERESHPRQAPGDDEEMMRFPGEDAEPAPVRIWGPRAPLPGVAEPPGAAEQYPGETTRFEPLGDRGFRSEIAAFVDSIRAGGPSPVPATDGVAALRTALAADQSMRTGAAVAPADVSA